MVLSESIMVMLLTHAKWVRFTSKTIPTRASSRTASTRCEHHESEAAPRGESLRLILISVGQLVSLVVVRRRETLIGLPRQIESLFNGPEACNLRVAGIDGSPVSGRVDHNVSSIQRPPAPSVRFTKAVYDLAYEIFDVANSWTSQIQVGRSSLVKTNCAQIVPEDVGCGDLSDSVDCRITNLRVSNTG